jgi:hypothetical protein
MTSAIGTVKTGLETAFRFLNQPGVRNLSFAFGIFELYDAYQIFRTGESVSSEVKVQKTSVFSKIKNTVTRSTTDPHLSKEDLIKITKKVIIASAKISLVLSMGVSRPGLLIISDLTGLFFTTTQLERVFGAVTNPWHPKNVCTIAALILGAPAAVLSVYDGVRWVYKKITSDNTQIGDKHRWLTDTKVRAMALFNTITNPSLFQVGRFIAHKIRLA